MRTLGAIKKSDLLLAVFVVAVAALLLVPLPTLLLDFLLSLNIAFSLLLLIAGLYTSNALTLLAFPSLLLLTTLFRLSLNVASTRLILTDGNAGKVIESFGTFLVRGEVLVGLVIFSIITVVNFIVIARGAGRISEVAARFALDALPGRQMAIDADQRAGNISKQEAEKRREQLRKESQLYGAMDGAMKFVQGDVIAGIFIIFVNIIGGLYRGVSSGLGFSDAVHTYTVLTVGDGLVTQVPALLISICAGIVVTRVSSGESATLGSDVGEQLFNRPGALIFSGLGLALLGVMPGLPIAFLFVGLMFAALGLFTQRARTTTEVLEGVSLIGYAPLKLPLVREFEASHPKSTKLLVISLDPSVLYRAFKTDAQQHLSWWAEVQVDFYNGTGLRLPELSIVPSDDLSPGEYSIAIEGTEVTSGRVPLDAQLIELRADSAALFGLSVQEAAKHPLSDCSVFWSRVDERSQKLCDALGVRHLSFLQVLCLVGLRYLRAHPEMMLSLAQVHLMISDLDKSHPGFSQNVLAGNFVGVSRFYEVLLQLAREGVSVKDFQAVLEAVISYSVSNGLNGSQEVEVSDIVANVRIARRRQLVSQLMSARKTVRVLRLADSTERALVELETGSQYNSFGSFSPEAARLGESLKKQFGMILEKGVLPVSILSEAELRPKIQYLISAYNLPINVVSTAEMEPALPIETLAVWSFEGAVG